MKLKEAIEIFLKLPTEIEDIRNEILDLEESKLPVEKKMVEIKAHFRTVIHSAQKDGKLLYTNETLRQSQLQVMLENDDSCAKYNEGLHTANTLIKKFKIKIELKKNQFKMLNTLIPFLNN